MGLEIPQDQSGNRRARVGSPDRYADNGSGRRPGNIGRPCTRVLSGYAVCAKNVWSEERYSRKDNSRFRDRRYLGVKVSPEETKATRLQELMTGGGFIGQNYSRGMSQSLKESAIVKEYYERPTKKYPQGRLITVCGGKLLQFGPLPYKCDKDGKLGLPFVKVCCIERPGIFLGQNHN